MSKTTIFIVEDDPVISLGLKLLLTRNAYDVIGTSKDANDALEQIKLLKPNIIIIDVYLENNTSGIWLGSQLNKSSLDIPFIYLTAYNERKTIDLIFQTSPACYIKKPFDDESLLLNIQLSLSKATLQYQYFLQVKDSNTLINIQFTDIEYIISEANYVNIHCKNKKKILVRERLGDIHSRLPSSIFKRIHRRYLININSIESINTKYVIVNNEQFSISRTYHSQFLQDIGYSFRKK